MSGGALLLAAGSSRRFGSDKRRHILPDGTPLLMASVALYAAAFPRLAVVLRPDDADLATAVQEHAGGRVQVITCPEARHGMGHSLACGARAAAGWSYAFVALADMAWVRPETLARLRSAQETVDERRIVQPAYREVSGHPVGFGAAHLPHLARLTGDEGARALVREAGRHRLVVPVEDPGVLEDLDHPPGC